MSEPDGWTRTVVEIRWQGRAMRQTRLEHAGSHVAVYADARGVAVHGTGGLGTPALRSAADVLALGEVLLLAMAEADGYAAEAPAGWRG